MAAQRVLRSRRSGARLAHRLPARERLRLHRRRWGENIAWGTPPRSPSSTAGSAPRPQGEHRERQLHLDRRRRRRERLRPALLDPELRHRRRRQPAASTSAGAVTGTGPGTASTRTRRCSPPRRRQRRLRPPSRRSRPGRRRRSRRRQHSGWERGRPCDPFEAPLAARRPVPFVQMATGRPVTTGSVRCRAEVEGRRLRVVANVFEAKLARCAWRVPAWAKGKRLTGVVAVQNGGTAATRLFIRTLR